jgi:hypothetical protein
VQKVPSFQELRTVIHLCVCFDVEKQVLFQRQSLSPLLRKADAGLVHKKGTSILHDIPFQAISAPTSPYPSRTAL